MWLLHQFNPTEHILRVHVSDFFNYGVFKKECDSIHSLQPPKLFSDADTLVHLTCIFLSGTSDMTVIAFSLARELPIPCFQIHLQRRVTWIRFSMGEEGSQEGDLTFI